MLRYLLAALLAAAPCYAQQLKVPPEIKGAPGAWIIVAPEVVEGGKPKWRIDEGLQEVPLGLLLPPEVLGSLRGKVFQSTTPGRYKVELWNAKGDIPSDIYTCWVTIGNPPPPTPVPVPVPPDPTPGPLPPVPPVAGPRNLTIIRESSAQGTALADLVRDLRNPTHTAYQYLKSGRHRLDVVDPDQVGSDGKLLITPWLNIVAGMPLPVLVISNPSNNTVLSKESISKDTSDANVILTALKKAGG